MDIPIEKKKGLKKKHIYWAIGIILFMIVIYAAFFTNNISTYRVDADKITIDTVKQGVFYDYITVTGHAEPKYTVYLAAEEGGYVEQKLVEEGAMVKKGEVILRLSNPDLNLGVLNSEAELAQKSNELRNTMVAMQQHKIQIKLQLLQLKFDIIKKKRLFEQQKSLYHDSLTSRESFLQAKENYEYACQNQNLYREEEKQDSIYRTVQVKQMEDDLHNMRMNLKMVRQLQEDLNVKAPVDGQLTSLNAEVGQSIPKGTNFGQIDIVKPFKLVAEIDESYIDRVHTGLSGIIERNGKNLNVTISKVLPDVHNGRFTVEMTFDNDEPENMRTGQAYYVRLQLGDPKKSLLLPRGQFFQTTGGQWIYVVSKDGNSAEKRSIKIGRQNPQYYELLDGLKAGDRVVTSDYENYGNSKRLIFK
jgi:HlyD family secretion protein